MAGRPVAPRVEVVVDARDIPVHARVRLAHAAVQVLGREHGVDLLHIKGPAVDTGLRLGGHGGGDVDVIVRPEHVPALVAALEATGWRLATSFTSGSAFEHAANYFHDSWGLLDVHRSYPGLDDDPSGAFESLWQRRKTISLAAIPCEVPDRTAQSLILLLHAARSAAPGVTHPDLGPNWFDLGEADRAAIHDLAATLHAEVALAAATGHLSDYAGDPRAAIWQVFTEGGSRLDEWRARFRAAPTLRSKASVAARSLAVNRYYLEQRLGRAPSRADTAREFVRRLGQAGREAGSTVLRRVRSR